MKRILFPGIFYSLILSVFFACTKHDSTTEIDYQKFINCKNSEVWDSTKITSQLIGSWKLNTMTCVWTGAKNIDTMDVRVAFESTGDFILKYNNTVRTQGKWTVELIIPEDSTTFKLSLDQGDELIGGVIFLCADQVLFFESSSDGCDKVYQRIR